MNRAHGWCAGFVCAVVLTPIASHAQDVDPHWTPDTWQSDAAATLAQEKRTPGAVGLRLDLTYTSHADERSVRDVLSSLFAATYRFHRHWAIGLDWPVAYAHEAADSNHTQDRVGSGNPLLSAAHNVFDDERRRLDVWAGATLPLAWLPDDVARGFGRAMYAYALASRGLWNAWLWAPESLGVASGGSYVTNVSPDVAIIVEGAAGATAPLSDVTQDAADLYAQVASAGELGAGAVWIGLRVQGVFMTSDIDALQTALSPYARVEVGAWSFGGRVLFNLDEPLGFMGAGIDAWSLTLHAEGSL